MPAPDPNITSAAAVRAPLHALQSALSVEAIAQLLPPHIRHAFDLVIIEETGSTNTDLLRGAAQLPSGTVLAAERQTAGRGRRGRTWVAPPGGSLAFSLLWKFERDAAALAGLSLAVGVAVARALERCDADTATHLAVQLKWPNDLLVSLPGSSGVSAKLGGILIELAAAERGRTPAVIGIGINLDLGAATGSIDQTVSDLVSLGVQVSRNALLAHLLVELLPVLRLFEMQSFAPLASEWNRRHAWQNQRVVLSSELGSGREGIARGADADGALLFETSTGLERIVSGEVSVRAAPLIAPT